MLGLNAHQQIVFLYILLLSVNILISGIFLLYNRSTLNRWLFVMWVIWLIGNIAPGDQGAMPDVIKVLAYTPSFLGAAVIAKVTAELVGTQVPWRNWIFFLIGCHGLTAILYFAGLSPVIYAIPIITGISGGLLWLAGRILIRQWQSLSFIKKGFIFSAAAYALFGYSYLFCLARPDAVITGQVISLALILAFASFAPASTVEIYIEENAKARRQKAILNNIPDIAWLKDKNGKYIAVNEPFAKSANLEISVIEGKTDFDIYPRDIAERYNEIDREIIRTGKQKRIEEQAVKNGKPAWFDTIRTPIYDESGDVIAITGIARDVTERKMFDKWAADLNRQLVEMARKMES